MLRLADRQVDRRHAGRGVAEKLRQAHEGRAAIVGVHVLGLRILLIGHHETAAPSGKNTWPEDRGGGVKAPLTIDGPRGLLSIFALARRPAVSESTGSMNDSRAV